MIETYFSTKFKFPVEHSEEYFVTHIFSGIILSSECQTAIILNFCQVIALLFFPSSSLYCSFIIVKPQSQVSDVGSGLTWGHKHPQHKEFLTSEKKPKAKQIREFILKAFNSYDLLNNTPDQVWHDRVLIRPKKNSTNKINTKLVWTIWFIHLLISISKCLYIWLNEG